MDSFSYDAYVKFVTDHGRPDLAEDNPTAIEPNREKRFAMSYFYRYGLHGADWKVLIQILEIAKDEDLDFGTTADRLVSLLGLRAFHEIFG